MRESRTYGSVRGALSNGRPYRDRASAVPTVLRSVACRTVGTALARLCPPSYGALGVKHSDRVGLLISFVEVHRLVVGMPLFRPLAELYLILDPGRWKRKRALLGSNPPRNKPAGNSR